MHEEQGEVYDVRSGDTNTSVGKCLLCVQEKSSWYEKGPSFSCVQHCLEEHWVLTDVNLPRG